MISKTDLYADKDGNIVAANDKSVAFLVARAGAPVPFKVAKKYPQHFSKENTEDPQERTTRTISTKNIRRRTETE